MSIFFPLGQFQQSLSQFFAALDQLNTTII